MFRLEKSGNKYEVYYSANNAYVGDFVQDVDSEFYFFPEVYGSWGWRQLLDLSNQLKEVNKEA